MDFYFMPYAPQGNTMKHMKFEDSDAKANNTGSHIKLAGYEY